MATDGGPNIERDGLVFGMDTGYGVANNSTATRFFKGKPTTNEFVFSNFTPSGYGGDGVVQTGMLDPFGTTNNPIYRKTGKLRFGVTGGQDIGSLYYGTTSTFSIYLRHVYGQPQMTSVEFDINDRLDSINYVGDLGANMTYEWKRFSVTAYHNNSSNYHFIDLGTYQGINVFEWCCPQIDLGSIATPFISNGTSRSSTQSLIDLTKSTNIDVSNVSFDSTGQPTFDGTDDYSQISLTGVNLDIGCTIEGVLKRNSTPTAWRTFFNLKSASSNTPFFEFRSGGNAQHIYADYYNVASEWSTTAATLPTGDFGHAVACYDGNGNIKMYFNGELIGTTTGVDSFTLGTSPRLTIGRAYSNDRYTDIVAPIVKVYNRPLLPEEVQQNYNTYKNRFNL
tara:strand:- start:53 stop:1234 length:1182 start_codon:yes stop_codon:yes gene_type:complete